MSWSLIIDPLPGNEEIVDIVHTLQKRMSDWAPAFEAIISSFHKLEDNIFGNQGPGWAGLAESTIAYKASMGYSSMIMGDRTGLLRGSLTGNGPGSVTYVTPFSVFVGTDVPYAGFHQVGAGHNPKRLLVRITPATAQAWGRIMQDYLSTGVATALTGAGANDGL